MSRVKTMVSTLLFIVYKYYLLAVLLRCHLIARLDRVMAARFGFLLNAIIFLLGSDSFSQHEKLLLLLVTEFVMAAVHINFLKQYFIISYIVCKPNQFLIVILHKVINWI